MVGITFDIANTLCAMYPDGATLGASNSDPSRLTYVIQSFSDSDTEGDYFVYDGHEYRIIPSSGAIIWTAMTTVCDDLGMQGVVFETAEEYEAVRDYILTLTDYNHLTFWTSAIGAPGGYTINWSTTDAVAAVHGWSDASPRTNNEATYQCSYLTTSSRVMEHRECFVAVGNSGSICETI